MTLGDSGITSDEPLDVSVGRRYLLRVRSLPGLYQGLLRGQPSRRDADRLFRDNAQHPPLGRLLVGLWRRYWRSPLSRCSGARILFGSSCARWRPPVGFWLAGGSCLACRERGWVVRRRVGRRDCRFWGCRGCLRTGISRRWTRSCAWRGWRPCWPREWCWRRGRTTWRSALAGLVWGLALLIKIHAWLLAPLVVVRLVWKLGWKRGLLAALAWLGAGLAVFLAGWPWLWFDTWGRLRAYLSTSVDRLPLRVEYFGQVYLDHDVPWHYPWVYFVVTVPVGLHLLGVLGVRRGLAEAGEGDFPLFLVGTIAGWLVLFSTNAPVYDGERLFLVVFPLWAILVGLGFGWVWSWRGRATRALLCIVFLSQGYGVIVMHPFGLSYYNLAVGGLPGAERLGLELTYWGDAIDRQLLDGLARRRGPGKRPRWRPPCTTFRPLRFKPGPSWTAPSLYRRKGQSSRPTGFSSTGGRPTGRPGWRRS